MKNTAITFIILFFVLAIGSTMVIVPTLSKLNDFQSKISTLNDDNTRLSNENIELYAKANLKSFENAKTLERFLKNSPTIKASDPYGYASETCVKLMREAKESGYWLGITAINTSDESIYDAMLKKQYGTYDGTWHVFNIAIVGDADIYLVDSQDANNYYLLSTMTGDFAEYNKTDGLTNEQINKMFQSTTTTISQDKQKSFGDAILEVFPGLKPTH
jgi:hypothetical protein